MLCWRSDGRADHESERARLCTLELAVTIVALAPCQVRHHPPKLTTRKYAVSLPAVSVMEERFCSIDDDDDNDDDDGG